MDVAQPSLLQPRELENSVSAFDYQRRAREEGSPPRLLFISIASRFEQAIAHFGKSA